VNYNCACTGLRLRQSGYNLIKYLHVQVLTSAIDGLVIRWDYLEGLELARYIQSVPIHCLYPSGDTDDIYKFYAVQQSKDESMCCCCCSLYFLQRDKCIKKIISQSLSLTISNHNFGHNGHCFCHHFSLFISFGFPLI